MASDLGAVVSIAVMLTLSGALHLYLWRCLVVAPRLRSPLRWMLAVVIVLFALLVPLRIRLHQAPRARLTSSLFSLWSGHGLAFAFYQLLVFVPADLIGLARRWRSLRSEKEHDAQGVSTESPEGRLIVSRRGHGCSGPTRLCRPRCGGPNPYGCGGRDHLWGRACERGLSCA